MLCIFFGSRLVCIKFKPAYRLKYGVKSCNPRNFYCIRLYCLHIGRYKIIVYVFGCFILFGNDSPALERHLQRFSLRLNFVIIINLKVIYSYFCVFFNGISVYICYRTSLQVSSSCCNDGECMCSAVVFVMEDYIYTGLKDSPERYFFILRNGFNIFKII